MNTLYLFAVVTGSADAVVRVYDVKTGSLKDSMSEHGGPIQAITVIDGEIYSASVDQTLKIWKLPSDEPKCEEEEEEEEEDYYNTTTTEMTF